MGGRSILAASVCGSGVSGFNPSVHGTGAGGGGWVSCLLKFYSRAFDYDTVCAYADMEVDGRV
jgi:hypothetical protein